MVCRSHKYDTRGQNGEDGPLGRCTFFAFFTFFLVCLSDPCSMQSRAGKEGGRGRRMTDENDKLPLHPLRFS